MDADNELEQPTISSSTSSSNSNSSSNLLVNLPMLPMLHDDNDADDDDDAADDDNDNNRNDYNDDGDIDDVEQNLVAEEHMPLHPPSPPPPSISLVSDQQHFSSQQQQESSLLLFNNNSSTPRPSSSSSSSSSSHNHQLNHHHHHQQQHHHHQQHTHYRHHHHHQQQQHQHSPPPSPNQLQQQQRSSAPPSQHNSVDDADVVLEAENIADSIDASAIVGVAANEDLDDVEVNNDIDDDVNLNVDVVASTSRAQREQLRENSQRQTSLPPTPQSAAAATVDVAVGLTQHEEQALLPPPAPASLPLSLPPPASRDAYNKRQSRFPPLHNLYGNSSSSANTAVGCHNLFSSSNIFRSPHNIAAMFTNSDNVGEPHSSSSLQQHHHHSQAVDRLKLLYPNVNESETPLPRCWSSHDKCLAIGLSQNNLRVHYKGAGKQHNDAASVRTANPIPPACGLYYFEVKIISKGKNGYMGIGLTAQQFRMNRLPGWDKQSYGYHGDDGNSFSSSGNGQAYGPTFTTDDIIGCCVNFVNNTCFYTKNGTHLGIAFKDLPSKLYPTVGLQTPGEEVDANFGQEPFKYTEIEDMINNLRAETKANIYEFPMPVDQGDPTTLLHKMVSSYLVHNGYSLTAEAFARTTGQSFSEDLSSIKNRQKILKLVMSGRMGQAIEHTLRSYPGLLENNNNLLFMLKCRQFIEMVNGSDVEFCPATNNKLINIANTNLTTATTQTQTLNQTSVIQSTKSYQNGSSGSAIATTACAPAVAAAATATGAAVATTVSVSAQTNTAAAVLAAATTNASVISDDMHQNDFKLALSMCDATADNEATAKPHDYYLNDVEMENGHNTNGNSCKNGNANNYISTLDIDEDMDVDLTPSTRKYCHGFERILEFGKELSQMGQQLEKDNKMNDEDRQMLEDAFSLIAYSNPWSSPLGWQLCPSKREAVCSALNSAILESMNYPWRPPLEVCVAHASELLKVMAQNSLGACAFVNIEDVFPQN